MQNLQKINYLYDVSFVMEFLEKFSILIETKSPFFFFVSSLNELYNNYDDANDIVVDVLEMGHFLWKSSNPRYLLNKEILLVTLTFELHSKQVMGI